MLDESDGMVVRCALKVEWIRAVDRLAIGGWIAALPAARWDDVRRAVLAGLGLDSVGSGSQRA